MKNNIKDLQSQIAELDNQLNELAEKNESDKVIGSLELKRNKLMDKVKKLKKDLPEQEAPKPLTLKEKLLKLVQGRVETQHQLYNTNVAMSQAEQAHTTRQLELQAVISELAASDDADTKKRFSNAEKRKFEFQLLYNNDPQIKELVESVQKTNAELKRLEAIDKIQKIDERYLFKLIDLELNGLGE